MRIRIENSATTTEATLITRSPASTPSASQIGDTSMPARPRSRTLSERSSRRDMRARKSIESLIGSLRLAKIPHQGGV
jgi:hypothetical protein